MRNMLSTYKFDFIRFMFAQRSKFRFVLVVVLVYSVCWSLVLDAKGPAQREKERGRQQVGAGQQKNHM